MLQQADLERTLEGHSRKQTLKVKIILITSDVMLGENEGHIMVECTIPKMYPWGFLLPSASFLEIEKDARLTWTYLHPSRNELNILVGVVAVPWWNLSGTKLRGHGGHTFSHRHVLVHRESVTGGSTIFIRIMAHLQPIYNKSSWLISHFIIESNLKLCSQKGADKWCRTVPTCIAPQIRPQFTRALVYFKWLESELLVRFKSMTLSNFTLDYLVAMVYLVETIQSLIIAFCSSLEYQRYLGFSETQLQAWASPICLNLVLIKTPSSSRSLFATNILKSWSNCLEWESRKTIYIEYIPEFQICQRRSPTSRYDVVLIASDPCSISPHCNVISYC